MVARRLGPNVEVYDRVLRTVKKKKFIAIRGLGKTRPRRSFSTKKDADLFRSQLIFAKSDGDRFSPTTNMPDS